MAEFEHAGINLKNKVRIKEILDSKEMLRDGRAELSNIMQGEKLSPEQLDRIESSGIPDLLNAIITERFKEALGDIDLEQRIRPEYVTAIDELTNIPDIDIYSEIMSIINDNNMKLDQGRVSNVVLSDHSPYVLKAVKPTTAWGPDGLRDFEPISDALGEEFLLNQAVATLDHPTDPDRQTYLVLQDKINLGEFAQLRAGHPNDINNLENLLRTSPHLEQNMATLQRFCIGLRKLEHSGKIIDALGSNIFFKFDSQGIINIKVVDYGCFNADTKNPQQLENIEKSRQFVSSLESIVG